MLKKIALFILIIVAIVMLFNLVVTLAPNWLSNIKIQLALLDYYVTGGYGYLVS